VNVTLPAFAAERRAAAPLLLAARFYDSRHLQADCKNRNQLRNPTLGNLAWAIFFILFETAGTGLWSAT